jgi:site-specific DNA recombinase
MTVRVALYARYSSDLQNERSAEAQLDALRRAVSSRGWILIESYADRGISGSSIATRPSLQSLMADAAAGAFDVVLTEALDRLSRSQSDIARIYELLAFSGVRIETLSGGPVTIMHIGLEGTMNRMFLDGLADKTRRGLTDRVRQGFSAGGRCYGYRVVRGPDGGGTGLLEIDPAEADVVRRIFADYAAGRSPRLIAHTLNAEGVPGPRGGTWTPSAVSGDRRAGDGILCQELYVGVRVFNRRRFRKHPETGRRSSVLNPPEAWLRQPAPELRILDDAAWGAAQARHRTLSEQPRQRARTPKRLLSGLMTCHLCAGSMALQGSVYRCSTNKDRGTCPNSKAIKAQTVERRVVDGVRRHLLAPDAVARAVREVHAGQERDRKAALAERLPMEKELAEIGRRLERAQEAYLAGALDLDDLARTTTPLKARRAEILERLQAADEPAPVVQLHPAAAEAYRQLAENIAEALDAEDADELRDAFRALIDRVDFVPEPGLGRFKLEIHGRLTALLADPQTQKNPRAAADSGVMLGAGAGFEPATFRL